MQFRLVWVSEIEITEAKPYAYISRSVLHLLFVRNEVWHTATLYYDHPDCYIQGKQSNKMMLSRCTIQEFVCLSYVSYTLSPASATNATRFLALKKERKL